MTDRKKANRFRIEQYVLYVDTYEVDAESPQKAMDAVLGGEGTLLHSEYCSTVRGFGRRSIRAVGRCDDGDARVILSWDQRGERDAGQLGMSMGTVPADREKKQ